MGAAQERGAEAPYGERRAGRCAAGQGVALGGWRCRSVTRSIQRSARAGSAGRRLKLDSQLADAGTGHVLGVFRERRSSSQGRAVFITRAARGVGRGAWGVGRGHNTEAASRLRSIGAPILSRSTHPRPARFRAWPWRVVFAVKSDHPGFL